MKIEPAHIDQIKAGRDGRMIMIDRDAGGVVEELKRIDPGFNVRFSEKGHYWVIYYAHCAPHMIHDTSCEDCRMAAELEAGDLVSTIDAYQNSFGIWEGLDHRIVEHIRKIGHSSYDFAKELEKHNAEVDKRRSEEFRRKVEPLAEEGAAALRKDLGTRYKGRIFKPRDV